MLYLAIIVLGAFLLFQIQPLIAKLILPLFGGGAAIWTACLLFFQAFLLLGYFYSHCLTKLPTVKKQIGLHGILLFVSLLCIPLTLNSTVVDSLTLNVANNVNDSPLGKILLLLIASIGLPYFLLSSTGPLVQRWLSYVDETRVPYKLYAWSNAASLLALLSYPFVFEPQFTLTSQLNFWSVGYAVFVLLFSSLCWFMYQKAEQINLTKNMSLIAEKQGVITKSVLWLWLLLSATGVILLVSTTNAMTQNIPPMPFLWVLPLCIYLATFIISFHSSRWYVRWYWLICFVVSSCAAILMFFIGSQFDIISQVIIYSFILFSACMICHGELARLKPSVDKLTLFYLVMSLGGFLGSAFVAFVAKNVFTQFTEFPLAIISVYILLSACVFLNKSNQNKTETKTQKTSGIESHESGAITISSKLLVLTSCISAVLLLVSFSYLNTLFAESNVTSSRNFYGLLSVKDVAVNGVLERRLIDGSTSHGTQWQSKNDVPDLTPRSYYRAGTGVALALEQSRDNVPLKTAVIGLGAGTLAAYGKAGDTFDFYELNPNVEYMANQYFSYLSYSTAKVNVIIGDGRVSLQQQFDEHGSLQYDVLIVDAFSGDSIPNHLLTKEALSLYFQQLKSNGVLAVHISNSHLDLRPLLLGLAQTLDKTALYFNTRDQALGGNDAEWVLLSTNKAFIENETIKRYVTPWPMNMAKPLVWTDDYSNLLSVLK